jgi:hypothetical protein
MHTYSALVKVQVQSIVRAVPTEIRATNTADAKLLLQAIYGFHAVVSTPTLVSRLSEISIKPKTPEQQRIANLTATKDRAADALKAERDKQNKAKAAETLRQHTLVQEHLLWLQKIRHALRTQ